MIMAKLRKTLTKRRASRIVPSQQDPQYTLRRVAELASVPREQPQFTVETSRLYVEGLDSLEEVVEMPREGRIEQFDDRPLGMSNSWYNNHYPSPERMAEIRKNVSPKYEVIDNKELSDKMLIQLIKEMTAEKGREMFPYNRIPFRYGLSWNHFSYCCGGVEIGNFDQMFNSMLHTLANYFGFPDLSSDFCVHYAQKICKSNAYDDGYTRLRNEIFPVWFYKGMDYVMNILHYRTYSTVVATTVDQPGYHIQQQVCKLLGTIGFKELHKAHNKGYNVVTTHLYTGSQEKCHIPL